MPMFLTYWLNLGARQAYGFHEDRHKKINGSNNNAPKSHDCFSIHTYDASVCASLISINIVKLKYSSNIEDLK